MAEGNILLSLNYEQFAEILSYESWFNLQREFKMKQVSLSQSLLIWTGESGSTWLLADFEGKTTYDIEQKTGTEGNVIVEIWESSSQEEQPPYLKSPATILPYLQPLPQGTHNGFIDFLTKLDLDAIDLEGVKRSDLSGAGFSFDFVHRDLLTTHKMLREILASSRESLIDLSRNDLQQFTNYLREFYEKVKKIGDFEIIGENPRQVHDSLLREISDSCENVKNTLSNTITYVRSRKVNQLEDQVKTTLTDAAEKFNTETEKLQKLDEEARQKEKKRQESFDQLYIQLQNQLTEKPISQYKSIFETQAKNHEGNARFWMIMAVVATAAFGGVFILLSVVLGSGGTQLTGILQNIFTKGFVLSPIYVWLNRSIKNYTAQKHLEVINTHRQNALETFDTFVAAAEGSRETRDEVLKTATRAIFDANQTGYLAAKTSGADNTSPVQQIIREVIPSKSSGKDD